MLLALLQAVPSPADELGSVTGQVLDFFKLIALLAGVLILAYLTIRYWLPRMTGMRQLQQGPIQVVARFPLEPRKTLYIIKTGSDMFLIGTSDSDMFFLTELDPQSIQSTIAELPAAPTRDFSSILRGLGKRGNSE
jgi:flagellar biogenesis protein FliO